MNMTSMTFSGCGSYRRDTSNYDEYIAIRYVFDKLEGGMAAFVCKRVWYFVVVFSAS